MSRIIAFGDIHGEKLKLDALLAKLNLKDDDKLVFLGDYIDRGSDSKGVIDTIIKLQKKYKVIALKGNHEQFFLDTVKEPNGRMAESWLANGGIQCLNSYASIKKLNYQGPLEEMQKLHGGFFENLQLTYETENFIFVHGYLSHELEIEDQEEFLCLWGRYSDIWPHKSGKTVVCGHSIQRGGPTNDGFKICIDTGSFLSNGYITALAIDGPKLKFIKSCDN